MSFYNVYPWQLIKLGCGQIIYKFNFFLILVSKSEIARQSEIDHVRICIVCMAGLVPFLVDNLAGKIFDSLSMQTYHVISFLLQHMCYTTEDFCLFLLCRDFRRMFMFPICQKHNSQNVIVPEPAMISLPSPQIVEESVERIPPR
jgi:hypothetical protein